MKDRNIATTAMPMRLPYNLLGDELVIADRAPNETLESTLGVLKEISETHPNPVDAVDSIMRGAMCLYHRVDNEDSLVECLYQAICWELG